MPFMLGSITARTAAAVTAASIALPPDCSTCNPAAEERLWLVAIMPRRPTAGDRVPRMLPKGRSPAGNCLLLSVIMKCQHGRAIVAETAANRHVKGSVPVTIGKWAFVRESIGC